MNVPSDPSRRPGPPMWFAADLYRGSAGYHDGDALSETVSFAYDLARKRA